MANLALVVGGFFANVQLAVVPHRHRLCIDVSKYRLGKRVCTHTIGYGIPICRQMIARQICN